ncbi:recombinase family protein, partial [Candidatus Micrarchaeota archaeon]|nr:recombinase family protein [Candidatus Micrarchaeota archaeon]
MNVLVYARVSSKDQADGYSIAAQLKACKNYCAKRGYKIVQVFEEVESAKQAGRPLFNDLVAYAKKNAKAVDALLFHKVDRACRNFRDYVTLDDLQ